MFVRVFVVALLLLWQSTASAPSWKISRSQARQLVLHVLESKGFPIKNENFDLESDEDKYFPNFYFFSPYYDTPERLVSNGHYAVNKRTGDVWEVILCQRQSSKKIRSFQKQLRKELGISREEVSKYSSEAPCRSD